MDTAQTITHVSLCAGYGGIDIGLKRAIPSLRTIAFSEIEAFACANLVSKMEAGLLDAAPIWTDVKTFPWGVFCDRVDVLSGGYPCQPFSAAGKRLGKEDSRHLWPWIADGIAAMRPRMCFFENVEGHISLGLQDVIGDLESLGYKATWGVFSASEVGAPHRRKRVFILAHRKGGLSGFTTQWEGWESIGRRRSKKESQLWPSRPGQPQNEWEPPRVVDNSTSGGLSLTQRKPRKPVTIGSVAAIGPCASEAGWREAQSPLGGSLDGASGRMGYGELCVSCDNRTDELRLLGNGVVAQCAERAFRVLCEQLADEI